MGDTQATGASSAVRFSALGGSVVHALGNAVTAATTPALAVVTALVLSAGLFVLAGVDVGEAFAALFRGAVGTKANLGITLTRATPLILVGLGVAFAMQTNFVNVGGEGQLYLGALVGTWLAVTLGSLPAVVVVPVSLVGAGAAGAVWALIPGLLRAYRGKNEVITTILLNYVGVGIVSYFIYGPFREAGDSQFPQTVAVPVASRLPRLGLAGVSVHLGFWITLALAVIAAVVLYRTAVGYELRVVGSSPRAAEYGAIPVTRRLLFGVVVAGGLAGLAGVVEILGVQIRLVPNFLTGVAFTAIVVALLGQTRPLGVILAGLFIGGLFNGAEGMQRSASTPAVIVYAVEALVVIFLLSGIELQARRAGRVTPLRRLIRGQRALSEAAPPTGPVIPPAAPPAVDETSERTL